MPQLSISFLLGKTAWEILANEERMSGAFAHFRSLKALAKALQKSHTK
jgi:hypothetical protein